MNSILTIHNKGQQYHVLLPEHPPQKVVSLLWWAVEREGSPLVSDMGRLAMFIIEQACKVTGARLLGGNQIAKMVSPKISHIYSIDRPERSLKLTMDNVILEDATARRMRVYDGAFGDFKKYLPTILANNL